MIYELVEEEEDELDASTSDARNRGAPRRWVDGDAKRKGPAKLDRPAGGVIPENETEPERVKLPVGAEESRGAEPRPMD
jgi:hypothetical protein